MAANVPLHRAKITTSEIASNRAVKTSTWIDAARNSNWAMGQGRQLVPAHNWVGPLDASTDYDFRYRVLTSKPAVARMWTVVYVPTDYDKESQITITTPHDGATGLTTSYWLSAASWSGLSEYGGAQVSMPVQHIEDLSSSGSEEEEISIRINVAQAGVLHSISCVEVPRAYLAKDTTEYGVEETSCGHRQPMQAQSHYGIYGCAQAGKQTIDLDRRVIFQHCTPIQHSGHDMDTTSTTYVDIFNLPPIGLGRYIHNNDTTRTLYARVYAWTDTAGKVGRLKFTTTSGDTAYITGITASTGWYPDPGDDPMELSIDCEDMTTTDGRRSSRWDEITLQWKVDSGAELDVRAISIWEAAP